MFKRSRFIHGDRSSILIDSEGGINEAALARESHMLYGTMNQFGKWAEQLVSPVHRSPNDENLTKQILYLNVLAMLCRDQNGKGVHHMQLQAQKIILDNEGMMPLRFKTGKNDQGKPTVIFMKKPGVTNTIFFQANPALLSCSKAGGDIEAYEDPELLFELVTLSQNADLIPLYIDYIAAVINLYASICLSRNQLAIKIIRSENGAGLSSRHLKKVISSKNINEKLKAAYIFAA